MLQGVKRAFFNVYRTDTARISHPNNRLVVKKLTIAFQYHIIVCRVTCGTEGFPDNIATHRPTCSLQIPGIRNSQLGIEVSGYGKPRIYIDGREVKNEEELRTISSEQIKNLKINKAPGAEYEANTPAIIQIATIKSVADYLFMNIGNTMGMRRKFSESPFVFTGFQIGKMASSFYYDFNRSGSLVKETYFRNIMRPNDTFKSEQKRELPFYDTYHSFSWSGDYTINKKNRLGFFYFFNHDNYAAHERGTDWSQSALGTQTKWIDRQSVQITNLHSATALYDFITDKYSIHASQDYAFSTTNSNLNASEHTNNKQSVVKSINNRDYHVLTSNLYNSFRVGKKSIGLVGGKYTLIKSSSRSVLTNLYEASCSFHESRLVRIRHKFLLHFIIIWVLGPLHPVCDMNSCTAPFKTYPPTEKRLNTQIECQISILI